jgi:hypothetical protein
MFNFIRLLFLTVSLVGLLLSTNAIGQEKKKTEKPPEPPKILMVIPPFMEQEKTTKILLRGKQLDLVTSAESAGKKLKIIRKGKAGVPQGMSADKLGDTEVEIEVTSQKEDRLQLIVKTDTMNSKPFELLIKNGVIPEKEPNQGFAQAQELTIPFMVHGKIQAAQDVDVLKIKAPAGSLIQVRIHAEKFGSPLDAILTVYDETGAKLLFADDSKESRDVSLSFKMPAGGMVSLCVQDAHDRGGDLFHYLLEVTK